MIAQPVQQLSRPRSLSAVLDKPREEFTRDDFLRLIGEHQLEKLTFHYTALDGKLKELRIPIQSRQHTEQILTDGERVDGSSLFKGLVDPSVSDLYVVPVYRSAFVNPFDATSLDFICRYINKDGNLAPFAPDTILVQAKRLFQRLTGLELFAFGELEFYVLGSLADGTYLPPRQTGYHASAPFMKYGSILDEVMSAAARISGVVKYAHGEVGTIDRLESPNAEIDGRYAEQMEIEFLPAPVDEMADHLVLTRWLIRNIAASHGCVATFAPKLEVGAAGNGMHVHLELRHDGKNIMTDSHGAPSTSALKVIGGLCYHADSLTAFGNMQASSYFRLVPEQEAPTSVCWSDMNRTAMIRLPLGWPTDGDLVDLLNPEHHGMTGRGMSDQTAELRTPDGSAITHLLLAGVTMAAEWGLVNEHSLDIARRAYLHGNHPDTPPATALSLPRSCFESGSVLQQKRCQYEREGIFPKSIIDFICRLLQGEQDEHLACSLAKLSDEKRTAEFRRIMHRELHKH